MLLYIVVHKSIVATSSTNIGSILVISLLHVGGCLAIPPQKAVPDSIRMVSLCG